MDEQLDTNKPSRELDAAVARVMGWTEVEYHRVMGEWGGRDPGGNQRVLFWFSGHTEHAWKIAEKFRFCVIPYGDDKWTAVEQGEWQSQAGWNAAETMPLAVCKCCLRMAARNLSEGN